MTVRFADTNILLYVISTDPIDLPKAARAREILQGEVVGLSVQVLQEFYGQATRVGRRGVLTHELASRFIESFLRFPVQPLTVDIVRAALALTDRFGISYWDAAILEAARALGCSVVLSEDLDDATDYAGIRVVNPFAPD